MDIVNLKDRDMLEDYLCVDESCEESFCYAHVVFVHPRQRIETRYLAMQSILDYCMQTLQKDYIPHEQTAPPAVPCS